MAALIMGCFILSPLDAFSGVLKDEVYVTNVKSFSLKDVCLKMTGKVYPIIEKINPALVDCMSKKINATTFCAKELPEDPYLARGKVLADKVECISSKRIIFKYHCEKGDDLCRDIDLACFKVKESLARRLELVHSSKTDKNVINCYFSARQVLDKIDI